MFSSYFCEILVGNLVDRRFFGVANPRRFIMIPQIDGLQWNNPMKMDDLGVEMVDVDGLHG